MTEEELYWADRDFWEMLREWGEESWTDPDPTDEPDRQYSVPCCEQIEGPLNKCKGRGRHATHHTWLKLKKSRAERRRAKQNPDCVPMYGRYRGWEW